MLWDVFKSIGKNYGIKKFLFSRSNLRRNNAFCVKKFNKDTCFPNLKISNISENVDCNIRESRGKTKELTYLSGHERIREIKIVK